MASVIGFGSGGPDQVRMRHLGAMAGSFDADSLGRLVQSEVIPRLLVAHSEPPPALSEGPTKISAEEVARFAPLALSLEAHVVLDEVEVYLRRGVSVETIFVELLAPAARLLGQEWDNDRVDFIDVTMGLWRLQEVLREIAARTAAVADMSGSGRAALFVPVPSDQHSFGASMVAECFTRAGWDAALLLEASRSDLLKRLSDERFDLVGLTVSCDCHIERLRPLIAAIRNVSCNPDLRVMIGGRAATLNPTLAAFVGADATATTATAAVATADRLLQTSRCAVSA